MSQRLHHPIRLRRHGVAVVACFMASTLLGPPLHGQAAPGTNQAPDSMRLTVEQKSPAVAAGLGLVLPGSAHWYAGEREQGRGAIVAAAYWAGVAIVAGGRTDRLGQVGGAVLVGALGFSIVDGVRAVGRFNRRRAAATLQSHRRRGTCMTHAPACAAARPAALHSQQETAMKDTAEFRAVASAMAKIDFCMMQTVGEHGVNCRPMSNNGEVQYDGDNWFFSRRGSTKVGEIQADDRVHLTFADNENANFIAVWGTGAVVDDVEMKKRLWQPSLERWFENGPEDAEVTLLKVSAHRIQTWGRMGDQVLEHEHSGG